MQQQEIQHLFLRAGFGGLPQDIKSLEPLPLEKIVDDLFTASAPVLDIDFIAYPIKGREEKGASAFQIVKMILKSKRETEDLNIIWLNKMAGTKAQLREKMTFFWHNHFSTNVPFAYLMQKQNNTIRKHALGKFGDMLHAIAKDPAMIIYLNNQQNTKQAPNENFAREVMELFTLGEGNYTEQDIKEAARAFTGWAANRKGEFEFHAHDHDDGEKTFFGKKGNFNGEDILNIILENKQTAVYLTTKIYREFVNDKINSEKIKSLSEEFYQSGYDITLLMKKIFTSAWFYDDENMGCKIASPVELMVRYKRLINLGFENDQSLIDLQKTLGQVLFFPPNVAGWKGGAGWIDSSSLLLRLNLAQAMLSDGKISFQPKPEFEETPPDEEEDTQHSISSDWSMLTSFYKTTEKEKLKETLTDYLIQCKKSKINLKDVGFDNSKTPEQNIINLCCTMMSLPEFQLI